MFAELSIAKSKAAISTFAKSDALKAICPITRSSPHIDSFPIVPTNHPSSSLPTPQSSPSWQAIPSPWSVRSQTRSFALRPRHNIRDIRSKKRDLISACCRDHPTVRKANLLLAKPLSHHRRGSCSLAAPYNMTFLPLTWSILVPCIFWKEVPIWHVAFLDLKDVKDTPQTLKSEQFYSFLSSTESLSS